MLELFVPGFIYSVIKDMGSVIWRRRLRQTPEERLALRQKWKPEFENIVHKNFREGLRRDVIVRDVRRLDTYPDLDDRKGISPWFRVGLIDTYHRGILVGLRWGELFEFEPDRWRARNYDDPSEVGEKVILAGKIPFENIEALDAFGDEYYSYPHIFCHFARRGEPYESLAFYVEKQLDESFAPYYTELASFKDVKRHTRRCGINSAYV